MNKPDMGNENMRESCRAANGFPGLFLLGTLCAALGGLALIPATPAGAGERLGAQDQGGAGVTLSKQATPKEVGLPIYPGAKPHKEENDDSPSVRMGIWGGTFGFKLAVMKMESSDGPAKIAEFYKKALARYGAVLNCSDRSPKANAKDTSASPTKLDCGDDHPEKGGLLFKAGSREKQHLVGIQPNGQGSIFQLVYVETRGDDKEKKAL